jgi:penicillin-binding protein 1A
MVRKTGRLNWLTSRLRRAWTALRTRPALAAGLVAGVLGFVSLGAGFAVGSWTAVCRDCPSIAQIYVWEPKSATQILDRNGRLITELFQERRTPVRIETLPDYVKYAFVAIEDKRFYSHSGFDPRGFMAATVKNLLRGRRLAGGSTITQQLARWMFSDEIGFERRPTRKLKELKVAIELEHVYDKDAILEAYINQVNYGAGRHGIESASQYFFGKAAIDLNPAEAALLAAVINLPESYSPFRHPDRARNRRNIVLRYMEQQGYLPAGDADRWMKEPLPEEPHRVTDGPVAPYFVEWVRSILDDRYGARLYDSGYRVWTTLDLDMQQYARAAMDSGWHRIEHMSTFRAPKFEDIKAEGGTKGASETQYLQGMFIAVKPDSGDVLAMIGGRDFEDSKFNRAIQALRQPGSTFKPFTYTAAIAAGIPASHIIDDSPIMLEQIDGSIYAPKNYEPEFKGPLTLRDALRTSVNTVAVKLGLEVGLETVVQTAHQLGITTEVQPYPSTPIGAPSVYPIEMVQAYTTFANTGTKVKPRPILKVEDSQGRLLWQTFPERDVVLDSAVTSIMRDMLRTVIDQGSGLPARAQPNGLPYEVPAAGKTGTTNDGTDVWFIGFTPDILAAVWFGFDRPKKILPNAAGGVYASPVWGQFMRQIYYGETPKYPIPQPWPWPDAITSRLVDRHTGELASSWCDPANAYTEHYLPGTEPTDLCRPSTGLFGGPLRGRGLGVDTLATDDTTRIHRRRRIF